MADYVARLAEQRAPAAVAARVKRTKTILAELGRWIDQYRGGMPAGFAAAIVQWESNGQMGASGDAGLGEAGYFQVPAHFPSSVGVPPAARLVPENNIFLGLLEYQLEAIKMHLMDRNVVLGSADAWKLARLAFAVGSHGAKTLIQRAAPTQRGRVFDAVRAFVDRTGGISFGSQSAGLVWYRVHAVDLLWDVGQDARSGTGSAPSLPPSPPGLTYDIPAVYRPYFTSRPPLLPVALALGALYLIARS